MRGRCAVYPIGQRRQWLWSRYRYWRDRAGFRRNSRWADMGPLRRRGDPAGAFQGVLMARSIWAGAGATLISEVVGRGAAMGFQMLVANQLGADRFGIVAIALASAAVLSPFADAGLPNLALRIVSESPGDPVLVRTLLGLKLAVSPLFLLPLLVWISLLPSGADEVMALLWAGAFYGFQASSDLLRQILRARQQVGRELSARVAYPIGNVLALVAVWRFHPGPSVALLALASGPATLTVAYLLVYPPAQRIPLFGSGLLEMVRARGGFLAQSVLYLFVLGLTTRVDAFLLERYAGRSEVGRYFAAMNLVMAGGFFAQGLSSYLYPRLHRQTERRARALWRAIGLQAALGATMAAGAAAVGPILFRTIFRAKSFHGAEDLLPGFGLLLCISCMDWLWLSVLIGKNRIWVAAANLGFALALKLVVGPFWIGTHGASGMVWTGVLAHGGTTLLGAFAAWRAYVAPDRKDAREGDSGPGFNVPSSG